MEFLPDPVKGFRISGIVVISKRKHIAAKIAGIDLVKYIFAVINHVRRKCTDNGVGHGGNVIAVETPQFTSFFRVNARFLSKGVNFRLAKIENIVALIDGRNEIGVEIQFAKKNLNTYLKNRFLSLFNNRHFRESLPGHLPSDMASQSRLRIILERIRNIIDA